MHVRHPESAGGGAAAAPPPPPPPPLHSSSTAALAAHVNFKCALHVCWSHLKIFFAATSALLSTPQFVLGSDWPSVSPFMAAKAGAVKQLRVCNIAPEAKVRCLYWLGNCLQTHQTCTLFILPFAMAPSTKSLITERLCTLETSTLCTLPNPHRTPIE
jgi:hypothetical protein